MCAGEGGSLIRLSYNKMSESRPRWVYIYAYRGGEKTLLRCWCTVGERKKEDKVVECSPLKAHIQHELLLG